MLRFWFFSRFSHPTPQDMQALGDEKNPQCFLFTALKT